MEHPLLSLVLVVSIPKQRRSKYYHLLRFLKIQRNFPQFLSSVLTQPIRPFLDSQKLKILIFWIISYYFWEKTLHVFHNCYASKLNFWNIVNASNAQQDINVAVLQGLHVLMATILLELQVLALSALKDSTVHRLTLNLWFVRMDTGQLLDLSFAM